MPRSGTGPAMRVFTSISTTITGAAWMRTWAARDATKYKEITVECVTLGSLFGEFGVPYYLKVDVEGVDQSVLEQLRGCRASALRQRRGLPFRFRLHADAGVLRLRSLQAAGSVHRFADERHGHRPCLPGRIVRAHSATICRGHGCRTMRWSQHYARLCVIIPATGWRRAPTGGTFTAPVLADMISGGVRCA